MGAWSWLKPGNDRQLAETRYAGQESASARAERKNREKRAKSVAKAARKGQAWEARDRAGDRRGGWYRPAR